LVPLDEVLESFGTLSLAIDRKIIALHGGEIWALPPRPAFGHRFHGASPAVALQRESMRDLDA